MRLIFIGTGEFAVPALEALVAAGHEIACVCSQPPRPAGRGNRMQQTPVSGKAQELGLELRFPVSVNDPKFTREISGLGAEVGILVDHGALLPSAVLSATMRGFLNIHPSLLPRWRGAAPIQRAIMAGDTVTGVCVIQMDEKFDCGPILMRREVPVLGNDTHSSLTPKLAAAGGELIVKVLADLDRLKPVPQCSEGGTHAKKIMKSETRIDWNRSADDVCRQIRGLATVPGAWTNHGATRLKVFSADVVEQKGGRPGEVLDGHLTVACGTGAVRLLEVQRPGKRPSCAEEFLRGYQLQPGETFGGNFAGYR